MFRIYVIGISGATISPAQRLRLNYCKSLVVSKRYQPLVEDFVGEIIPIVPVKAAVEAIENNLASGDVAVLASGDPLFFGIGRTLIDRFGGARVEILPEISFLQLACARFKIPWDDARVISLHGRNTAHAAAELLRHPKVIVFTDNRLPPDGIAAALLSYLELVGATKKLADLRLYVAENLGTEDENLVQGSVRDIAAASFAPVNLMIITSPGVSRPETGPLGLLEAEITKSRGLITKDEVRAVTLHKLRLLKEGVFWDIGGGSGSISIEAARLCPELFVCTIEKEAAQLENIRRNIIAFETFNVLPVAGSAPDVLADLPDPDRIFVGGSGGRLEEILSNCADRLKKGGRIVVNCVIEETRKTAPQVLARRGFEVALSEVHVSRIGDFNDHENRIDFNPITIVTGIK